MPNKEKRDSLAELIELLKRKSPAYLDLLTASNDADFEAAFSSILEGALMQLEASSKEFEELSENGLSAVLAAAIQVPGLVVSRETNSNGHVDLTITMEYCRPSRKKLGEAKIWRGPSYHVDGLEQLLARYSTGREGRGLVISYVRQRDIKDLITKLRQTMDTELPHSQISASTDHPLRWAFVSTHAHSSGEVMEVAHVGCNLFNHTSSEEQP